MLRVILRGEKMTMLPTPPDIDFREFYRIPVQMVHIRKNRTLDRTGLQITPEKKGVER